MRRVIAVALLFAASARAQEEAPRVRLIVERGPGTERCVEDEALREGVHARLGRDPFDDDAPRAVRVTLARERRVVVAHIESVGEDGSIAGSRELRAPLSSCAELVEQIALTIGIAIDPIDRPPPEPEPEPEPVPEPAVVEEAPIERVAEAPPPAPGPSIIARFALRVGFVAFAEPVVSGAFLFSAGVRYDAFSIDLEGRADVPVSGELEGGGTFESHVIYGGLAPCAHVDVVALCGLVAIGALRVSAEGLSEGVGTSLWAALGARAGIEIPIADVLYLSLLGDLLIALTRTTIQADGSPAWTSPPLSFVLAAGAGVAIP